MSEKDTIKVKPVHDEAGNATGEYYYVRVAPNGEPVNTSEAYADKYGAVEAAKREAGSDADVVVDVEPAEAER